MHKKISQVLFTLIELFNLQTFKMKIIVVFIFFVTVIQFLIELALAASLQSIVHFWGLLPSRPEILGFWPFESSLNAVVIFFIALGTARGYSLEQFISYGVYGVNLENGSI